MERIFVCQFCDRVFSKKTMHICIGGFRKSGLEFKEETTRTFLEWIQFLKK